MNALSSYYYLLRYSFLPYFLLNVGIHSMIILGNLVSLIRLTWPYHISCLCSTSFIIVSSIPILKRTSSFRILSILDIPKVRLNTSISVASSFFLFFSVIVQVSAPYSKVDLMILSYILCFRLFPISLLHHIPFRHPINFLA